MTLSARLDRLVRVFVKRLLVEPKRTRDEHRREALDRGVQIAHGGVVIAPRALQLTFDIRQLVLQLEEIRVGLELRIGLGNGEQASKQARHLCIRLSSALDTPGGKRLGAVRAYFLKHLALVGGVSLNGFHEIRNQVRAAAELHGDSAEALLHQSPQPDQPVVQRDGGKQQQDDCCDDDPADKPHAIAPLVARQTLRLFPSVR